MPVCSKEDIAKEILSGEITALSIDTNIFESYGFGFEYGILKSLTQFHGSGIRLLIPSVIYQEVHGHMLRDATETAKELDRAVRKMGGAWGISRGIRQDLIDKLFDGDSEISRTQKRLDSFCTSTGLEIVKSDGLVSIDEIISEYFSNKPPFEAKKEKKSEFPDAIALATLENLAIANDIKILLISADGGWRDRCLLSLRLFIVDKLQDALSLFQKLPSILERELGSKITSGSSPAIATELESVLIRYVDEMDLYIDASAAYRYETDFPEKKFESISYFLEPAARIIDHDVSNSEYTIETSLVATIEVSCDFTFYVRDEGEDIPIAGAYAERTGDLEFSITFKLIGDPYGEFEIHEVEVIKADDTFDFGSVEPDYGDPDYD